MKTPPQNQSWEKWTRWEQLGDRSSRWTTGFGETAFAFALIVFTILHLFLSVHFPLAEDELYYWNWSRTLQWSYFDHPPMVAYLIRLSTAIFGQNAFGIRFFATGFSTLVLWILSRQMHSRRLVLLVGATPLVAVLSLYMTPDVPLLFFWLLYTVWAASINRQLQDWSADPMHRVYRHSPVSMTYWILGGICLGLGILSKYTMAIAPGCLFLLFIFNYQWRAWFLGLAVHLGVAALVASPILIYNYQNAFQPLHFQWAHSLGAQAPAAFWEFVGAQVLLVGALPFLLLPWVLALRRRLCAIAELQTAYYFFLPPLLFFLFQASRARMEGNWALVAYVTFWPIAQTLFDDNSFKSLGRALVALAMLPAFVVTLGLLIHSFHPFAFVPPEKDRLYWLKAKADAARAMAGDIVALHPGEPIFTPTYQWTSYLRFYGADAQALRSGRMNHFILRQPSDPCAHEQALALVENGAPDGALACFGQSQALTSYPLVVRGKTLGSLTLQRLLQPNRPAPPSE